MKVHNVTQQQVLATDVKVCHTFLTRLRGLLGTKDFPVDKTCWIKPCNQIHTMGMKYNLDAYFLDKNLKVVGKALDLKPTRFSAVFFKAHSVIEFKSGTDRVCEVGDQLEFIEDSK